MALYVERQANRELSEHLSKALPTAAALRTIAAVRRNRSAHQHDAAALHMKSAVADTLFERVGRMRRKPGLQQRLRTGREARCAPRISQTGSLLASHTYLCARARTQAKQGWRTPCLWPCDDSGCLPLHHIPHTPCACSWPPGLPTGLRRKAMAATRLQARWRGHMARLDTALGLHPDGRSDGQRREVREPARRRRRRRVVPDPEAAPLDAVPGPALGGTRTQGERGQERGRGRRRSRSSRRERRWQTPAAQGGRQVGFPAAPGGSDITASEADLVEEFMQEFMQQEAAAQVDGQLPPPPVPKRRRRPPALESGEAQVVLARGFSDRAEQQAIAEQAIVIQAAMRGHAARQAAGRKGRHKRRKRRRSKHS